MKSKTRRKVKKIIDGDTFEVASQVRGSNRIRLANTDAPEKGQKGSSKATRNLSRLKNKFVTIDPVGKSYGRTVANVEYRGKKVKANPEKRTRRTKR